MARSRSRLTVARSSSSESSVKKSLAAALQEVRGKRRLIPEQLVNLFFHRPLADELVDEDIPLLPDAIGAVGGLVFHGGVPPAVEVDDVRGRGEVEPRASRLEREDEEGRPLLVLEGPDEFLPLRDRCAAVENEAFSSKDACQKARERLRRFRGTG